MSKPYKHALSTVKKFGGKVEDYLPIHNLLDSSKSVIADNRHRMLTHNSWFISTILEKIFGVNIQNSEGVLVSVRDVAEQHVLEDYGMKFIPTAQDFAQEMPLKPWMQNADGVPPSVEHLYKKKEPEVDLEDMVVDGNIGGFSTSQYYKNIKALKEGIISTRD